MSKVTRYIIEGEWSGYTSGQRKVVHRSVHKATSHLLRAWVEKNRIIRYTDGTGLCLSVRDAKPRERVQEKLGYASLIRDCFISNVTRVADLPKYYRKQNEGDTEKPGPS